MPPSAPPLQKSLPLDYAGLNSAIEDLIVKDKFDLSVELKMQDENCDTSNFMKNENIEDMVKLCKKYELAQQRLQTELDQEQQLCQAAMLSQAFPVMPFAQPSNLQSIYQDRTKEKLAIKKDQNILLEKTNTQLCEKLYQFKEKYSLMKNKFKAQIAQRDAIIAELQSAQDSTGKGMSWRRESSRGTRGQQRRKGSRAKQNSPLSHSNAHMMDPNFNSTLSANHGAYYQTTQSQANNPFQMSQ